MKKVWLLIEESESLSLSSKYFRIYVGESKQDQADWAYVNLYAAIHNYFFEKWSNEIAQFIDNVTASLNCDPIDLNFCSMNVGCLVKYMKEHGTTPDKPKVTRFQDFLHHVYKPKSYYDRQNHVLQRAEAKQRNKPKARKDSPQGS